MHWLFRETTELRDKYDMLSRDVETKKILKTVLKLCVLCALRGDFSKV